MHSSRKRLHSRNAELYLFQVLRANDALTNFKQVLQKFGSSVKDLFLLKYFLNKFSTGFPANEHPYFRIFSLWWGFTVPFFGFGGRPEREVAAGPRTSSWSLMVVPGRWPRLSASSVKPSSPCGSVHVSRPDVVRPWLAFCFQVIPRDGPAMGSSSTRVFRKG